MYAIVRTGGKQYKVKAGDLIKVEKLEKSLGDEFELDEILFVSGKTNHVGEPTVSNAKVTAVVTQQHKHKKIIVFKKKRRQGYRKLNGHRQNFTELFIKAITAPDGESVSTDKSAPIKDPTQPKKEKVKAEAKAPAKKTASKKTATKKPAAKKKTTKKKTTTKKKATKKKTTKKA
ncbi:MAG: 50S ribosomal protein L21 [Bdellovibrionales bacterium]|nr:50S ribosomal protein L21 [Bdellovibrionales bacterium]